MGSVGHMYLLGVGVAQSNETARHYFQKGAEKGCVFCACACAAWYTCCVYASHV